MKIYFAGNFPQMIQKGKEEEMFHFVNNLYIYRRLVSYHFIKISKIVLELNK